MIYILKSIVKNFKWILLISLILIINIFYNKNFLNLKRGLDYNIIDFNKDIKMFLDRDYLETSEGNFLQNKKLIQINRHNKNSIYILNNSNLIIYRAICEKNNNETYNLNWEKLSNKVNIKGLSCTHSKIFFKKFNNYLIKLDPGGPISADPIFIEIVGDKKWFKVLNKKK